MDFNQNNFNQNNYQPYGNSSFYNAPPMGDITMRANKLATSSKTMGIVGLILSLFCCPIVGLILDIIAIVRARTAKVMLGYNLPEGKVGRVCGIIALILGIIWIVSLCVLGYAVYLGFLMTLEELDSMMALVSLFL